MIATKSLCNIAKKCSIEFKVVLIYLIPSIIFWEGKPPNVSCLINITYDVRPLVCYKKQSKT